MIRRMLPDFKVKMTGSAITSRGGLPLIAHLAESLGLMGWIEEHLSRLKQRNRGYSVAESILACMLSVVAGGESLDDTKVIAADRGLAKLLAKEAWPAPITLGELLRRFNRGALKALWSVNARLVGKILWVKKISTLTLDFDATLIESRKHEALKTYEGFGGYCPLLGFISELKLVLARLFRPGNASPAAHGLSFLKASLKLLPPWITQISIRSDSAWYNHSVMGFCHDRGILFCITADRRPGLIEELKALPDEHWQAFDDTHYIAKTVHVVGKSPRAYRLIALRTPAKQLHLFDGPYLYKAVVTNIDTWSARQIILWHRKRADSENIVKELKHGFALRRLPCGGLLANAAFF